MMRDLHRFGPDEDPALIAWFDDFDGDHPYQALSNFYEGEEIHIQGVGGEKFATGEHAFAALKAYDPREYQRIQRAKSPAEAKALGRACKLRPDWESVKYDVMMAVLRSKFALGRVEADILLETGDALLVEGTYWGDQVWGVELYENSDPLMTPGRNWLGTLLMARRAELRAELRYGYQHPTGLFNARFAIGK